MRDRIFLTSLLLIVLGLGGGMGVAIYQAFQESVPEGRLVSLAGVVLVGLIGIVLAE